MTLQCSKYIPISYKRILCIKKFCLSFVSDDIQLVINSLRFFSISFLKPIQLKEGVNIYIFFFVKQRRFSTEYMWLEKRP